MTVRTILPACPRCGYQAGFVVAVVFGGAGREYYDDFGNSTEIDNDGMLAYQGRAVRCIDCNKIRRDVICVDGKIVLNTSK